LKRRKKLFYGFITLVLQAIVSYKSSLVLKYKFIINVPADFAASWECDYSQSHDAFTAVNLNISFKPVYSACLSKAHFKFFPRNLKIISTKCSIQPM